MSAAIIQCFSIVADREVSFYRPGIGFLEALVAPNTTAYPGGDLKQITSKGFIDPDGNEREVDVIILATGFNTTWVPRFPIVARGNNLQDMYRGNPLSYLGVSAPEIPNYFTYYGPYGRMCFFLLSRHVSLSGQS